MAIQKQKRVPGRGQGDAGAVGAGDHLLATATPVSGAGEGLQRNSGSRLQQATPSGESGERDATVEPNCIAPN